MVQVAKDKERKENESRRGVRKKQINTENEIYKHKY
jgi:hypothetical protein